MLETCEFSQYQLDCVFNKIFALSRKKSSKIGGPKSYLNTVVLTQNIDIYVENY